LTNGYPNKNKNNKVKSKPLELRSRVKSQIQSEDLQMNVLKSYIFATEFNSILYQFQNVVRERVQRYVFNHWDSGVIIFYHHEKVFWADSFLLLEELKETCVKAYTKLARKSVHWKHRHRSSKNESIQTIFIFKPGIPFHVELQDNSI
jgi:hypothetical protein